MLAARTQCRNKKGKSIFSADKSISINKQKCPKNSFEVFIRLPWIFNNFFMRVMRVGKNYKKRV